MYNVHCINLHKYNLVLAEGDTRMDGRQGAAPKLSVIMPVRNMENTLPRAIESALMQDCDSYELIIVLNGCTDSSYNIAASYAQKHPSIHVIENNALGYSNACNRGMDEAQGDFIMFLDADDYYLPGAFKALADAITRLDCDVVYSSRLKRPIDAIRDIEPLDVNHALMLLDGMYHHAYRKEIQREKRRANNYAQWGNVYKAAFLKRYNIRCDPQLTTGEDFLFNRDVLKNNPSAYVLPQRVYHYEREEKTEAQVSLSRFDAALASVEAVLAGWPHKGFANKDEAYGFASVMLCSLAGNVVRSGTQDVEQWFDTCFKRPAIHELLVWIIEKGNIKSLQTSFGQYFDYFNELIVRIVDSPIALSNHES